MPPTEGNDRENNDIESEVKKRQQRAQIIRANAFILFIALSAFAVAYHFLPDQTPPLQSLIFFLAVIALTESLPVELPRAHGTMSVGFAMCYSAVLLFGPFWGGLLTAFGSMRKREFIGEVPIREVIFNRSQLFLAAVTGGVVFASITGGSFDVSQWLVIAGTILGGISYFLVNVTSVVLYFSLKNGSDPWALVLSNVRWSIPSYMGLMPIAYLNAAVYVAVGKLGVIFFLLPLMVGRYAFQMYNELRQVFVSTISALAAALEARDPHTSGHAERVSYYAVQIAKAMDFSREEVELLEYVSILHDIGKIGISDSVLQKPGSFDESEWKIMKQHSRIGANILKKIKALKGGASWVLYHHERYDGTGYPEGLQGEDIPLQARILAVADAFDAMLSKRPYKEPMTLEAVQKELKRCRGTQFDPEVVDVLVDLIENSDIVQPRLYQSPAVSEDAKKEGAAGGDGA